jgi:DNA modification methylase
MKINEEFLLRDKNVSNAVDTINLARHRWYYYKEGFSPALVESAIDSLGLTSSDIIVDPFNGSGTVTLSAAMKGIKSFGFEVNPFTAFIAKTKVKNANISTFDNVCQDILSGAKKQKKSPLLTFSTFSENSNKSKWLFNADVLNSFEGGISMLNKIDDDNIKDILKLSLIGSIMDNSNARRDGKCLRYKNNWVELNFNKESFLRALGKRLQAIREDLSNDRELTTPNIVCGDSRSIIEHNLSNKFSLCITSPPYLNTFDYTDIYRPELFLGRFINSMSELYDLRLNTVRSHVQVKWNKPTQKNFGTLYDVAIKEILSRQNHLMHKDIPFMIQAYFEDMQNILSTLKGKAKNNAELWLVVSTSAYAGIEIPVDMIIGEIGNKSGWYLKDIGVLRYLKKRKSKYSNEINQLRESVVIFTASGK